MADPIHPDVRAYAQRLGVDLDTVVFPYGYGGSHLTMAQCNTRRQIAELNPEYRKRVNGLMVLCAAHGIPYGFGGGSRDPVQQLAEAMRRHSTSPIVAGRVPPKSRLYNGVRYYLRRGMAPYAFPGSSNHERDTTPDGAIAADMVPPSSLAWANKQCPDFSLQHFTNVGSEPWHTQPAEWPKSRSGVDVFVRAGRRLAAWALPGVPASFSPAPGPVYAPAAPKSTTKEPRMITISVELTVIEEGARGRDVALMQGALNALSGSDLDTDGYAGPVTIGQLRNVQAFVGAKADGICGPKTWKLLLDPDAS